jgi:hypothetical protein
MPNFDSFRSIYLGANLFTTSGSGVFVNGQNYTGMISGDFMPRFSRVLERGPWTMTGNATLGNHIVNKTYLESVLAVSGNFTGIPLDVVRTTGFQDIVGPKNFTSNVRISTLTGEVIVGGNNAPRINVVDGHLQDSLSTIVVDWADQILFTAAEEKVMRWFDGGCVFYGGDSINAVGGILLKLNSGQNTFYDYFGNKAADLGSYLEDEGNESALRVLYNDQGNTALVWSNGISISNAIGGGTAAQIGLSGAGSVISTKLFGAGSVMTLDARNLVLSGNWLTNTTPTHTGHILNKRYLDIATGFLTGTFQSPYLQSNSRTGDYTLVLTDAGKIVEFTGNGTGLLRVPTNSVLFPTGTQIILSQYGTGVVQITGLAGVTLRSRGGLYRTNGQYAQVSLVKRTSGEWMIAGDLTA